MVTWKWAKSKKTGDIFRERRAQYAIEVHLYDMAVAWHVPKTTSPPGCHRDTWYYVTGLNDILRTSEMMSSSSHHWHITDTCSSPVEILQDTDTDDTPSFVMLDFWSDPSLNCVYSYKTRATLETLFYDALYKISCSTKIALSLCNEWMSISNTCLRITFTLVFLDVTFNNSVILYITHHNFCLQ